MRKLTNKIIDNRLANSSIRRIGDYIKAQVGLPVKCLVCKYEWSPLPDHLCRNGDPKCKNCSGCAPITLERIDNIAKIYGGICISLFRIDHLLYAKCKCIKQHEWDTLATSIIGGHWCRKCFDIGNLFTLEELQTIATKHDGKCISKEYNGGKAEWLCKNGHTWLAKPSQVKFGKWCKRCSLRKNEKLMLSILEENGFIIESQKSFTDIHTGNDYFLDCYLPKYNIIIEYNGDQHYKPVRFHSSITQEQAKQYFIDQQIRDKSLQKLCDTQNIPLIWIDGRKYKDQKLKDYMNNIIQLIKLFSP